MIRGNFETQYGKHKGNFINSKANGYGFSKEDQVEYEGTFENGKLNGSGICTQPSSEYTGTWRDDIY